MGQTKVETRTKNPPNKIGLTKALMIAAVSLMSALRVIALDSDAYSHLSYSSALLTDEGFYIHNARNIALFGHARTDQFNNMLIMPALHQVQVWVFSVWGVGAVQARAISVAAGLLTLIVFFFACRRCFGNQIACIGLLFLGLGHANLLYGRMALMDTPAALGLVCVFAAWIFGVDRADAGLRGASLLFGLSGAMIAVTYATRGLSIWILPVPIVLLLYMARVSIGARQLWINAALSEAAGFAFGMAVYLCAWYLPHHIELGQMTRYYLLRQMVPHSILALRENVAHALVGDSRGLSPYLFRHSPVEFGLSLALLLAGAQIMLRDRCRPGGAPLAPVSGRTSIFAVSTDDDRQQRLSEMAGWFLTGWLLIAWLTYSVISYSPDRYYVLFYPALAAVSAIAVSRSNEIYASLRGTWAFTMLVGFLAYHAGEAVVHHNRDWLLAVIVLIAVSLFVPITRFRPIPIMSRLLAFSPALLIVLWATVNTCWTADWLRHITYVRSHADSWLAQSLPADSVLIGDVAPGLCLDNRFIVVNVIPGLCNANEPLEQFAGRQRYIVILDERFLEKYWTKHYPSELTYERRISLFPSIVKFPVGIYRVGDAPGPGGYTP